MNNRFKSCLLYPFVRSLQSKETQKVHQRFRAISAAESKKSGSAAADRLLQSPISQYFARFSPKMHEKTSFVLVDKRGFFDGEEGKTRTTIPAARCLWHHFWHPKWWTAFLCCGLIYVNYGRYPNILCSFTEKAQDMDFTDIVYPIKGSGLSLKDEIPDVLTRGFLQSCSVCHTICRKCFFDLVNDFITALCFSAEF